MPGEVFLTYQINLKNAIDDIENADPSNSMSEIKTGLEELEKQLTFLNNLILHTNSNDQSISSENVEEKEYLAYYHSEFENILKLKALIQNKLIIAKSLDVIEQELKQINANQARMTAALGLFGTKMPIPSKSIDNPNHPTTESQYTQYAPYDKPPASHTTRPENLNTSETLHNPSPDVTYTKYVDATSSAEKNDLTYSSYIKDRMQQLNHFKSLEKSGKLFHAIHAFSDWQSPMLDMRQREFALRYLQNLFMIPDAETINQIMQGVRTVFKNERGRIYLKILEEQNKKGEILSAYEIHYNPGDATEFKIQQSLMALQQFFNTNDTNEITLIMKDILDYLNMRKDFIACFEELEKTEKLKQELSTYQDPNKTTEEKELAKQVLDTFLTSKGFQLSQVHTYLEKRNEMHMHLSLMKLHLKSYISGIITTWAHDFFKDPKDATQLKRNWINLLIRKKLNKEFKQFENNINNATHPDQFTAIRRSIQSIMPSYYKRIETKIEKLIEQEQSKKKLTILKQIEIIENDNIKNLIIMLATENHSRPKKIDLAYELYQQVMLELEKSELNFAQEKILLEQKEYALTVLQTILKTKELVHIKELMQEREEKKPLDPSYIPGVSRFLLTSLPDPINKTTKFGYQWLNVAHKALASERKILLPVHEADRIADATANIRMLTMDEREALTLEVKNKQFYLKGKLCQTKNKMSHDKIGYAAYVLTDKEELILFNHHNSVDLIAHSSVNAGAPVRCAGELKIVDGKPEVLTAYSGHYRPSEFNIFKMVSWMQNKGIDISNLKLRFLGPLPDILELQLVETPKDTLIRPQKESLQFTYNAQAFLTAMLKHQHSLQAIINMNKSKVMSLKADLLHIIDGYVKDFNNTPLFKQLLFLQQKISNVNPNEFRAYELINLLAQRLDKFAANKILSSHYKQLEKIETSVQEWQARKLDLDKIEAKRATH